MTPQEIARSLTKAQRDALVNSVDFGTYRMVPSDNPEAASLNAMDVTVLGIVRLPIYEAVRAILEQQNDT